ncbi:MAG: hypothetical protein KJ667_06230, partial [Alphaproteobacteria bacterium]|nr:hypothetical protein [Alphaproteobacteria bacterium]
LFAFAVVPLLLLAAFSAQAQAPSAAIAPTFNEAALQQQLALSCSAQQDMRRDNLLPPYFPGTPPAFENKAGALALYSPHLTNAQRKKAEDLFASVPDHVRAYGFRAGAVYTFPRRGIVEAVPGLSQDRDYYSDTGLYMAVQRTVFVPFEKGRVVVDGKGMMSGRNWTPSLREPFRIINHESGHMIDDLIGDYSHDSLGDDGDHRLSNRKDFLRALEVDLRRLTGKNNKVPQREIQRLGYYLPDQFEGKHLGGLRDTVHRARREVFAELWAEAQGYDSNKLSTAYPDAYKAVKDMNDYLKSLHDARPVRCVYGADGTAQPAP